uniref:Uncharacterized protein n=1 Tax=Globodera rostochiensis TaxID=31243 RepID=A0A914HU53_GLORO
MQKRIYTVGPKRRGRNGVAEKTPLQITISFIRWWKQYGAQFPALDARANETKRSKERAAMQHAPLFHVEPSMTVPPSLHIVACQGLFSGVFTNSGTFAHAIGVQMRNLEQGLRRLAIFDAGEI